LINQLCLTGDMILPELLTDKLSLTTELTECI